MICYTLLTRFSKKTVSTMVREEGLARGYGTKAASLGYYMFPRTLHPRLFDLSRVLFCCLPPS
jgi:hypothetical protein